MSAKSDAPKTMNAVEPPAVTLLTPESAAAAVAAPVATVEPPPPMTADPTGGGSYWRDPSTGALKLREVTQEAAPRLGAEPIDPRAAA